MTGQRRILIVAYAGKGHINPALRFGKLLLKFDVEVTVCTSFSVVQHINKETIPHGLTCAKTVKTSIRCASRVNVGMGISGILLERSESVCWHYFPPSFRTPQESFSELPLYCHNLKLKNQGTITHIETDDEDRFEIFFLAIGAVIRTFVLHMRPLIIIDGAHLKGEFLGTMYLAVAMDGNNQISTTCIRKWGNGQEFTSPQWYFEHRQTADEHKRELTPWAEAKLAQRIAKSATWTVRPAANYLYNVVDYYKNATVDLNTRTCSCGQWQLSGLPCGHLIAVMRHLRQSSANQFAFSCFKTSVWRASYNEVIYDVGHPSEWDKPDGLITVLPPVMDKRLPGRPRNRDRFRSKGEQIT
ncbi:probable purine permease 11 [Tanacetum coccineum]